ncbi:hypothetical protein GIB67_039469 [Kingdonia uniflora]|uniref:Uncharacterized protein n=1 Tax=Kingdonia uniflora TaxID=39325 RepID=A0A7J7LIN0_9MAGN|nr:hypothetical protein GIB67_039469 [Kingdonia uniflora]
MFVDAAMNLKYANLAKLQRNLKDDDEPFILASQATQSFIDGTYPEEMKEQKERMNRAIQKDLILMDKDLDNDAVAVEYGADGNGQVMRYNGHLNKTNIIILAPLRRVIERERVKQAMLNEVQESLEVEANKHRQLEKRVLAIESRESPSRANMHRPFENNVSTSQGRRCSPPPPESLSNNSCILKDMFGTNVAYEIMQFNTTAPEGFYSVIIDKVIRCMLRVIPLVMSLQVKP